MTSTYALDAFDGDDECFVPEPGMTAEELAQYSREFIDRCASRIIGIGKEQYSGELHQKFEAQSLEDLIEYALEELEDNANYSAMIHIRLRRIQKALRTHL